MAGNLRLEVCVYIRLCEGPATAGLAEGYRVPGCLERGVYMEIKNAKWQREKADAGVGMSYF